MIFKSKTRTAIEQKWLEVRPERAAKESRKEGRFQKYEQVMEHQDSEICSWAMTSHQLVGETLPGLRLRNKIKGGTSDTEEKLGENTELILTEFKGNTCFIYAESWLSLSISLFNHLKQSGSPTMQHTPVEMRSPAHIQQKTPRSGLSQRRCTQPSREWKTQEVQRSGGGMGGVGTYS